MEMKELGLSELTGTAAEAAGAVTKACEETILALGVSVTGFAEFFTLNIF